MRAKENDTMSTGYYLVSSKYRCYVFVANSNGAGVWPPSWNEFIIRAISGPEGGDRRIFLVDEYELHENYDEGYEEVFIEDWPQFNAPTVDRNIMPETITVQIGAPIVTALHFPFSVYDLPPGGTLRLLLGDTVYTFRLDESDNTIWVNAEKPNIHDWPSPEVVQQWWAWIGGEWIEVNMELYDPNRPIIVEGIGDPGVLYTIKHEHVRRGEKPTAPPE
jgi:hypothetical protein